MKARCTSVILLSLLAGCAAQAPSPPDQGPDVPLRWRAVAPVTASDVSDTWWQGFASDELGRLISQAQEGSLDMQAAAARILRAEALARTAGASLWPTLDGALDASREGRLGGDADVDGNDYSLGLNARYDLDLWGRNRALRDAALAELQASRFDHDNVRLTLTTAVANQWLLRVGLRQRLAIARLNLNNAEQVLATVESRGRAGSATPLELAQQRGLVAEQRRVVQTLRQEADESEVRLALLLGVPVQRLSVRTESLEPITWPVVGAGVPSQLVLRRPDVARAEAQLSGAQANVEAARAALLPNVTVGAGVGIGSDRWATLIDSPLYSLSAGVLAPIFDGGSLRAQRDEAQARQMELLADYRRTLISALADVELGLTAASGIDGRLTAQDEQVRQAREAFRLAESRYRAGAETLLVLLDTQRTLYTAQDQWVQLRLARLQASVALFKALGGGWKRS